jgi:hypothetical protein
MVTFSSVFFAHFVGVGASDAPTSASRARFCRPDAVAFEDFAAAVFFFVVFVVFVVFFASFFFFETRSTTAAGWLHHPRSSTTPVSKYDFALANAR